MPRRRSRRGILDKTLRLLTLTRSGPDATSLSCLACTRSPRAARTAAFVKARPFWSLSTTGSSPPSSRGADRGHPFVPSSPKSYKYSTLLENWKPVVRSGRSPARCAANSRGGGVAPGAERLLHPPRSESIRGQVGEGAKQRRSAPAARSRPPPRASTRETFELAAANELDDRLRDPHACAQARRGRSGPQARLRSRFVSFFACFDSTRSKDRRAARFPPRTATRRGRRCRAERATPCRLFDQGGLALPKAFPVYQTWPGRLGRRASAASSLQPRGLERRRSQARAGEDAAGRARHAPRRVRAEQAPRVRWASPGPDPKRLRR